MVEIDLAHVADTLKSRLKTIAITTLSFTCIAAVVGYGLYNDKYQSVGTLLFNAAETSSVVTSLNTGDPLRPTRSSETSVYKNQEQLLKSGMIAKRVLASLEKEGVRLKGVKRARELHDRVLNAEHVRGTDFIRISAMAGEPKMAQRIASAYLNAYLSLMNEISYAPLMQQKVHFEKQVEKAERNLTGINREIEEYQARHGIVDINIEGQDRVHNLISLDADAKSVEAKLAEKRAEVSRIRNQLKLNQRDISVAIHAVANGQNSFLNKLQENMKEAQKEYNAKALIYSVTNPDMQQLQEKIDTLKKQIIDQQILTVGEHSPKAQSLVISDPVRTDLVSNLAAAEADAAALKNKLGTIRSQYSQLKGQLQDLPSRQLEYARLQLERKDKEEVLTKLKQKLAEVHIQEAALQKKLMVIDQPNLPQKPLFPQRWHIIALGALLGLGLSSVAVIGQSLWAKRDIRPEFLENTLGLPLLSMIPWLPEEQWQRYRSRGLLEVTASPPPAQVLKAYQDLALNLKAQRNQLGKNTLVASASMQSAANSVILANLAFCLAQSGERVLLVDANLRKPRLHEAFNHSLSYEHGLPELINGISEAMYRNGQVTAAELMPLVQATAMPSGIHPQLHYLNAGVAMENPFEFLNAKGFGALVQVLRTGYDWVLLDAPPFLQVPDAAVLLGYTDGLLFLVERDADEAQVMAVRKKVARLNSTVVGAVLRTPKD